MSTRTPTLGEVRRIRAEHKKGWLSIGEIAQTYHFPYSVVREVLENPAFMARPYLTTTDVLRATRITYRQLDHWTRRGYIQSRETQNASKGSTPGSGHVREYTETEARVAAVTADLLKTAGMELDTALTVARRMVHEGHVSLMSDLIAVEVHKRW